MSEDSIFIVAVEDHNIAFQTEKTTKNMFILFIFHVLNFILARRKQEEFTANAALSHRYYTEDRFIQTLNNIIS